MKILPPDPLRLIKDLRRRIEILERRQQPAASAAEGDNHDGAGNLSVLVTNSQDSSAASTGDSSIAIGAAAAATENGAIAIGAAAAGAGDIAIGSAATSDRSGIAIGTNADATGAGDGLAIAIGLDAQAIAVKAVALGWGATAGHNNAVAIGDGVDTTNSDQFNIGAKRLIAGCPTVAAAGSELINSQVSFSVDQTGNNLTVTVKYSTGVVKTGSVALT